MNWRDHGIIALLALAFIALLLPLLLRVAQDAPVTPGAESYRELAQAQLLRQGSIGYDPVHQSYAAPALYTLLLIAMEFFGVPWMLPLLLALAFLLLLYLYLRTVLRDHMVVLLSLLIVIVSPTMSVLGTSHGPLLLCMVLILVALLLKESSWAPAPIVALAVITSPALGLLAAAFFLGMFIVQRRAGSAVGVALGVAAAMGWFFLWLESLPRLSLLPLHTDLLFELGRRGGISVFYIVFAAYGLLSVPRRIAVGLSCAALAAALLYVPSLLPVAVVVLSVLSAHAIQGLLQARWELDLLRQSLVVLVACLGLFLLIVTVRERAADDPDAGFARAMIDLGSQRREGAVLSAPAYAPMIEYFSGRVATLGPESDPALVRQVLHTRDAPTLYAFLEQTGTSYVFITQEMVERDFSRSDEGILFLLPNTERFVPIMQRSDSTLWYYIRR